MFGGRREFFRARTGSWNYNLNNEDSDEDFKVFVYPTFDDLYTGKQYSYSYIGKEIDLNVHDTRKLPILFWKSNIAFLELLYSDKIRQTMETQDFNIMTHLKAEQIINETGCLMHDLFQMRDKIVTMNLPHLYDACIGTHMQERKQLHKGTESTQRLVDEFGFETKCAIHSLRVLDFLDRFEQTGFTDFKSAIWYPNYDSNRQLFLSVRHGEISEAEFTSIADERFAKCESTLKEKYRSQPVDDSTNEKLISLVKKIVKLNMI